MILVYTAALIAVLAVLSAVLYERLQRYDRAARYSSGEAFETAVKASHDMSEALKKVLYATDPGMCAKLCAEIYADALAAEAAISALPFDTFELEKISAFVNTAGDYAYALCASAAAEGFTQEQSENLRSMSTQAKTVAEELIKMQSDVHNGAAVIDDTQQRLQNIGGSGAQKLSAAMLAMEDGFEAGEELEYDGQYSAAAADEGGTLTEAEILSLAARAAGVEARELKQEYGYEGENARRLYSAGDRLIIADNSGVRSMGSSRLVSGENVTEEEARIAAESCLAGQGYDKLVLREAYRQGGCMNFKYAQLSGEAVCEDNFVSISIALDSGEVYSMNAEKYRADEIEAEWKLTEEEARKKLPQGAQLQSSERVIISTAGGKPLPCYKYNCTGEGGESLSIYVQADTGRQYRIVL